MNRCALMVLSLPLVTATAQTSTTPNPEPPSLGEVRAWIAQHHPETYFSDSKINLIVFVVDARNTYVKSFADSMPAADVAVADSGIARTWRFKDDSIWGACVGAPTNAPGRPICLVDGVRVPQVDAFQYLAIRDIAVLTGWAAVAKYGAGAAEGVLVATTDSTSLARFRRLGIEGSSVGDTMLQRLRAGVVGPNQLFIRVLILKDKKA